MCGFRASLGARRAGRSVTGVYYKCYIRKPLACSADPTHIHFPAAWPEKNHALPYIDIHLDPPIAQRIPTTPEKPKNGQRAATSPPAPRAIKGLRIRKDIKDIQDRIRHIVRLAFSRKAKADGEYKQETENPWTPGRNGCHTNIGTGVSSITGQEWPANMSLDHQLSPIVLSINTLTPWALGSTCLALCGHSLTCVVRQSRPRACQCLLHPCKKPDAACFGRWPGTFSLRPLQIARLDVNTGREYSRNP